MELEQDTSLPSSNSVNTKIISHTVTALVILLVINPAWIDNGGFGSGIGVLLLGWAGILVGVISWYWFIGYNIFINSLKSGLFWNWNLIKKSALVIFLSVCSFTVFSFINVGEIAPGDFDCQCQKITQLGAGYFLYQILLWYLIVLSVSLGVMGKSDESLNKFIKIVSFVALGLGIIVTIFGIPLILIQFGSLR